MNIMELGALGEFFGAIAVLATLAYLAIQIRQNTKQVRGQAFISLADATRQTLRELRTSPDLADTVLKVNSDWDQANQKEQRTTMFYNLDEAQLNEVAYVLWQQGSIDDEQYQVREEYWLMQLLAPGRRKWWDEFAYYLDRRFCQRINDQLAQLDKLSFEDLRERFPAYWSDNSEGDPKASR